MIHSTIIVTGEHEYQAEMQAQRQDNYWPLTFEIEVHQHPMIEGFPESGKFYGNCHLGCSKDYPTIEAMVSDLLRRHGYTNARIVPAQEEQFYRAVDALEGKQGDDK